MSALISHLFISISLLFIFSSIFPKKLDLKAKEILFLSFFAILPDLDAFIFIHRVSLHNIFFLVVVVTTAYFITKKKTRIPLIIGYYMLSHIILDLTDGGVSFLYPLTADVIFLNFGVVLDGTTFSSFLKYGFTANILPQYIDRTVMSSENSGTIVIALLLGIYLKINTRFTK